MPTFLLPRSEIWLTGGNGHGSSSTKIRRFTSEQVNVGTAISYTNLSTTGAVFTINITGWYDIEYVDGMSGGVAASFGITVNSAALTTDVLSGGNAYPVTKALTVIQPTNAATLHCSCRLYLTAGDIVRPHTNGGPNASTTPSFRITHNELAA